MAIYEKIFHLFKVRINDDCVKESTRKLLSPIFMFMDLYEKERSADLIHEIFQQACIEFQWFYWSADEYYGGVGEWREFPPVCISQINKAIREKKTSVQIVLSQRNYIIDFTEMTKRLIQDNVVSTHYGQYSAPVFAKAKLMDEFNFEEFRQKLIRLTDKNERDYIIVKGIIKLLQSSKAMPLESELACSALTLLLRLVTNKSMAGDFIENDGILTLMQLRLQTMDGKMPPTLINTIIFLLLRKCIDSNDLALKNAFDQMLINTCNGLPISLLEEKSRRHGHLAKRYRSDSKRVFRLISPMAAIYSSVFIEQVKLKLEIRKGELKIKDKDALKNEFDSSHDFSNLKKVLQSTLIELQRSVNKSTIVENYVLNTSNLLKFIAELIRSYPQASFIFVHMTLDKQNVINWLVDKLLLNYNKGEKDAQEVFLSTKAVLSCLIGDHSSEDVVDRVVDDIKNLLLLNFEEYSKSVCQVVSTSEKTKLAIKFADQLITITQLLVLFRDAAGQGNTLSPGDSEQMVLLVKSMTKSNLFNILVKSIWYLPFQEPQGFEAVNTLLKLFESVVGKDMNRFTFSRNNALIREPSQHITNRTIDHQQQQNFNNPTMDIDVGGITTPHLGNNEHQSDEIIERNADLDSIFTISIGQGNVGNEVDGNNQNLGEDNEHEEESSTQSDEEEDDMDTAEEMEEAQADATAEEAAEEDMEEDDDERNSENMIGEEGTAERATNQNFVVDVPDEVDDDDEEEEEEWDDEGGNNDETLVEFDDAMADYLDMVDFSDFSNELNSMRQSIHRFNVEFSNAFASQRFQQVERTYQTFMQQIPRHFRALISHPRGGGSAVLRIRNNGAHNLPRGNQNMANSPIRIGIARGIGGDQIFGQLLSQMAGWPSTIANGGESQTVIMTPYFVDRLLDMCRILDPHSMFLTGVLVSSYVSNLICIQDTPEVVKNIVPGENAPDISMKQDQQPSAIAEDRPVGEDQSMQQIAESQQENEQQMAVQIDQPTLEEHQVAQNEQQQRVSTSTVTNAENVSTVGVPEGVDPAFLAALPEEMRQEVIRDHLIQQQMNTATNTQAAAVNDLPPDRMAAIIGMEVPEGMDPAFLAALPEDIFQEVVRDHQRQQELARQRRAQVDAQNMRPRIRHHQHHHRHFAMPHLFQSHGLMRSGITSNSHPDQQITMTTNGSTHQLFDIQSICTLLLLYLLDQDKFNIVRLQKLLRSVCLHPGSCDFTIWALLSMLDGLQNFGSIEVVQNEKSNIGWINNLRSGASLDKNERIIRITSLSVQINHQVRNHASHHIVDMLGHLAQRFSSHFMPKSVRGGNGVIKPEQPPNLSIFWSILRSINSSTPEQMLISVEKPEIISEIAAETLETSPFAYVIKFIHSQLPIADKIIRTTSLLAQRLPGNFCEKATEETKKWIGQELNALTIIILEKSANEALRDGRALIAQLLSVFPEEKSSIMATLNSCILKSGDQLREQLSILQNRMREIKHSKNHD